jgi:hypothetical protein
VSHSVKYLNSVSPVSADIELRFRNMPPRKHKSIGQVQSNARRRKQQLREETLEERNRRLSALRGMAATSRALETVQQRVCVFVCSSITLERLERFRPNLVHIWLYVCVRILCIYIYIFFFYFLSIIFSREDGVGGLHGIPPEVTNRCRRNVYANRYRSNGPICGNVYANRCGSNSPIVCVVLEHTYKHASNCI